MQMPTDDLRVCCECHQAIMRVNEIVESAKNLSRLYTGLLEENPADLTLERLNAYRAHFNLKTMITHEEEVHEDMQVYEYIEYNLEPEEEALEDETVEMDSSMKREEEEIYEEEVYEEEIEELLDDSQFSVSYVTDSFEEKYKPPQSFSRRSDMTTKTDDEMLFTFQCHLCAQPEFLKMRLLTMHCRKMHNCLPLVKCCSDDCDAVLSTWRRLMIHKEKHFPNYERLRCSECYKVYMTEAGLNKHRESHKQLFICNHCGKEFKEAKTLKWHEATHLKPLEERKCHQCPYEECGIKFITKQACQNHIGAKHQKVINVYCKEPDCGKGFFTRKAYHEHVRNSHSERKFFCDQCNFKGRTKAALNTHKDIHRTGETYSCDLCSAVFTGYRRLKSHMSKSETELELLILLINWFTFSLSF